MHAILIVLFYIACLSNGGRLHRSTKKVQGRLNLPRKTAAVAWHIAGSGHNLAGRGLRRRHVQISQFPSQVAVRTRVTMRHQRPESRTDDIKTLPDYLAASDLCDSELAEVLCAVSIAASTISQRLRRLSIAGTKAIDTSTNVQGEVQAGMDVVSNRIMKDCLNGVVAVLASEEEEEVVPGTPGRKYEIAFDPLDGSSNLDISMPTGTIFGIFLHNSESPPFSKSGRSLIAAGYALYSTSTELVIAFAPEEAGMSKTSWSEALDVVGFTLDPMADSGPASFVLTRASWQCPEHGPYYSLNDAREPDWPSGLKRWVHDAKLGSVPSGTKFSARYVCALVADVHRTLLRGGWAGNPRPHLRLLYEAAPLALVAEACGGKGSDGVRDLLDIEPTGLHDRVCVFIGSRGDVLELVEYGDVQQGSTKYVA